MKKRLAKKTAKRFLSDRTYLPYGTREEEVWSYNDGTPPFIKVEANFPPKIRREIFRLDKKARGPQCHWDDPTVLSIDDRDVREYEARFKPPHCR